MRGRTLASSVPALGLEAGDRLEPSPHLTDVADFSSVSGGEANAAKSTLPHPPRHTHKPGIEEGLLVQAGSPRFYVTRAGIEVSRGLL